MSDKVRVSIIGTAGRKDDAHKMNKDLFNKMVQVAEDIIVKEFKLDKSNVTLVSGGSAWADHIAVRLWLESISSAEESNMYAGLKLYLPCPYTATSNGIHFQNACGTTLNELHSSYSSTMGDKFNSRADLLCAEALGAEFNCSYSGFLNRNLQVAKSEYVIAFTWSDANQPKAGGTKHTWDHSHGIKLHIPLKSLTSNTIMQAFTNNTNITHIGVKRKIDTLVL